MNENQTPSQILHEYQEEMHAKVALFVNAYNFYPVRPGSESFESLPLGKRKYSAAFFSHPQIVLLEDRIHDWVKQCEMLRVYGR